MIVSKTDGQYNIDSKIIVGVGVIAVALMLYFAVNKYQMVFHVGKLAENTEKMTAQMVVIGSSIKKITKDTNSMSKSTKSMDRGIKNVTSPRGMMNMWRR